MSYITTEVYKNNKPDSFLNRKTNKMYTLISIKVSVINETKKSYLFYDGKNSFWLSKENQFIFLKKVKDKHSGAVFYVIQLPIWLYNKIINNK